MLGGAFLLRCHLQYPHRHHLWYPEVCGGVGGWCVCWWLGWFSILEAACTLGAFPCCGGGHDLLPPLIWHSCNFVTLGFLWFCWHRACFCRSSALCCGTLCCGWRFLGSVRCDFLGFLIAIVRAITHRVVPGYSRHCDEPDADVSECVSGGCTPFSGVMFWTAQNRRTCLDRVHSSKKVSRALLIVWQAMHHKWKWPTIAKNKFPNRSYTGKTHKNSVWYLKGKLIHVCMFRQLIIRCVNILTARQSWV